MVGAVRGSLGRVLMISARSDIGGGPAHMFELARGVLEQATVYVALPNDGCFYAHFQSLIGSEKVFSIPRQKFKLEVLIGLWRFAKRERISLIHSHGKGAGVYGRLLGILLGISVVHTLHGYHDGRYGGYFKRLYAIWEKLAALVTSRIICVSTSEAELFQKKVGVPKQRIIIIPNGTPIVKNIEIHPLSRKVVTVARFEYQKNLLELLRVAQQLPEYVFNVIGDGVDWPEIEAFIRENKIENVILRGASHTVMSDIADADLYLTTARWEGLPLAVLEAMSLGIPVVASDVVGNRDAVEEGVTGYLYPLGNILACGQAVAQAITLDRLQIQRFHREHFSSEKMIARTLGVYKCVLDGRMA